MNAKKILIVLLCAGLAVGIAYFSIAGEKTTEKNKIEVKKSELIIEFDRKGEVIKVRDYMGRELKPLPDNSGTQSDGPDCPPGSCPRKFGTQWICAPC